MTRQETIAYLAGIADGEAYIGIKKSKAYRCQGRRTPGYHARIQIRMVDDTAIKLFAAFFDGWMYAEKPSANNGRPLWCLQLSDRKAETALRTLFPYLRVKKAAARAALTLRRLPAEECRSTRRNRLARASSGTTEPARTSQSRTFALSDEYVGWCESLYLRCKAANRVGAR